MKTTGSNGLAGKLYYLDAGNPAGYTTSDQYIQYGHSNSKVTFVFSQLNVIPYNFSQGFQLPNGGYVTDAQGNKLTSFFGFQFTTTLALASGDQAGYYEMGTLADDGVSVRIIRPDGTLESLVEDEGNHSPELGCAKRALYLDSSSRIPLQINWHQGPPVKIGIMLLWRPVDGSASSLFDTHCGVPYEDSYPYKEYYFDTTVSPSKPLQGWTALQSGGWKSIPAQNFLMPDQQTNSCVTP